MPRSKLTSSERIELHICMSNDCKKRAQLELTLENTTYIERRYYCNLHHAAWDMQALAGTQTRWQNA